MKPATQLPLKLPHRPALSGNDFFVAPANTAAIDWIDRWPNWSGAGVIIHGERGSGKSHLLQVFAARSRAVLVGADNLGELNALSDTDTEAYGIDDADEIAASSADAAEAMFHLFNTAKSMNRKLFLTARAPAARWDVPLKDLMSRLKTLDNVAIGAPDDTLLSVLLMKQFSDRQIKVEPDVIAYLTARMERSTAAVVETVDTLDREALARKQAITVPLARVVLDQLTDGGQKSLNI